MKNFKKPDKKRGSLLSAVLLALACVAAVELAICAHFSPELYNRITAPARTGIQHLAQFNQRVWTRLCQAASETADYTVLRLQNAWESLVEKDEPDPEPEDDIQLVTEDTVTAPPRPRADYTITALAARNSQEYLTGGFQDTVYFNQTSQRWSQESYGSDRLGGYGCGPTAMAMTVSTLTDSIVTPVEMAEHCVSNGYWAKKQGSYLSIVQGVSEDFGLTCIPLAPEEADEDTVAQYLATGHLIIALMGPGHFTNGGHFIILRGITLDGSILVADPASSERSLITWDLELIVDELSASRHSGSPLWIIAPNY